MLDLSRTPFSRRGSYMALVDWHRDLPYAHMLASQNGEGLYLKSVRNRARAASAIMKFTPLVGNEKASYDVSYDFHELRILGDGFEIKTCFANDDCLLMHCEGSSLSLVMDFLPVCDWDYAFELPDSSGSRYLVVNSYKSQTKYFVSSTASINLRQEVLENRRGATSSTASIVGDSFDICIQDVPTHLSEVFHPNHPYGYYADCAQEEFQLYLAQFPEAPARYKVAFDEAVYTTWSATVRPSGILKRDATWMSNTVFPGVWSWDHCFNTAGLMTADPDLAWDNMAVMFDYQDELGQLPGSANDSNMHWNFAKPPIQGLFAGKMLDRMELSENRLNQLYRWIDKQVAYWFGCHDCNDDGVPEYHHGNDSGHDNSTVFDQAFAIDSPDLLAFLICALETLGRIDTKLGRDARRVLELKGLCINRFVDHFVVDGRIVARDTLTQEVVECRSILPLMSIVAGKYLPKTVVSDTIERLKARFLTDVGIATEEIDSPCYESDGYWRGPVWAPEMVILIDALNDLGEHEFVKNLVKRFVDVMTRSGFAENFDAITGAPLKDPAHTWTSSSYLYLVEVYHDYLES